MQAIEGTIREKLQFVKAKLSRGDAPEPAQLAAFLRALVNALRPHISSIPSEAKAMLQDCFKMARWDVRSNAPLVGSKPCTAGELVAFLETAQKRLRVGVVTAGWGDCRVAQSETPLASASNAPPALAELAPNYAVEYSAGTPTARTEADHKTAKAALQADAAAIMADKVVLAVVEQLETNPTPELMDQIDGDECLQSKLALLVRAGA